MKFKRIYSLYIVFFLIFFNALIWNALYEHETRALTIGFLNIGQGDGIYIEAPNGNQIMFDGGPDSSVLSELGRIMPWYDRSLDMLVVTNPDKDHYGGFIDVIKSYSVGGVVEPGTVSHTSTYKFFEDEIASHGIPKTIVRRGMTIVLDREHGVYIEILFPDTDVSSWSTNDGSIVARLVYGQTSVLLTGDSPQKIESYLIEKDGANLRSTVLKIGHHGSRTSSSDEYVSVIRPEYAVISDGKNNRYGHPHKETLDTLNRHHIQILRTDQLGTIIMKSDGEEFHLEN